MATVTKTGCKQSTKTSNYRSSLAGESSERYSDKLNLIQIGMCPFDIPVTDWKDSVKLWPPTEFPDLCMYLLDTPGVFTKEKLKTYKSLEAYNYFNSGYVRTCMYFSVNTNFCVIKASVNPSQRTSDNPHEAWVAINKKDGSIVTGHCKCMAGLGETCSHVAAILFKIEAANRLGYTRDACTSEPCVWNQTFTKKVHPEAIVTIDFKKPKRGTNYSYHTEERKCRQA